MNNIDIERYKNVHFEARKSCTICEEKVETPVIDMPSFPLTEIYVKEEIEEKIGILDQGFCFCSNCGHGQIMNVIDVELQYGMAYYFRVSPSTSGRETAVYFIDFFNKFTKGRTFRSIIELGCNDLYLLKLLKTRADKLIGIDPILKGKEALFSEDNVTAIGDFFENVDLDVDVDVVICKDTLEHISHPKQFLKKIVDKAQDNTLFFFQFPLLEPLLADCRFDQVFHQHLNYFSMKSILYMLNELGCRLLDYTINYNHWGSILMAFQKGKDNSEYRNKVWDINPEDILERYGSFKADMEQTNKRLEYFKDEVLYGYGAALMLPVLSYYLENDLSCLNCVIDDNKEKDGLYYINLPVPIVHSSKVNNIADSVILLTAIFSRINRKSVLEKLLTLKPKHIIYPLKTI